jgi:multidrug resistance efflux pump
MDGATMVKEPLPSFCSPPRILIPKLVHSRDTWKAKAGRRQRQLKKEQIRSRDLTASRKLWKDRARAAELQVQALQQQLQLAQHQLEQTRVEVDVLGAELKKKRWPLTC